MDEILTAKKIVEAYSADLAETSFNGIGAVLSKHLAANYRWRGVHPFGEDLNFDQVQERVYRPLRAAFPSRQWRRDIFFAGTNDVKGDSSVWTCAMGHMMGLFDVAWLDIPPTRRIVTLRYAEFHRVHEGKIAETAVFFDLLDLMRQAGHYPLPPPTGAHFTYPGPRTHDGILNSATDPAEGPATMALVNRMIEDLDVLNKSGEDRCPPEYLARTWHDDMIWYGPAGIGATMSIPRYQQQHQFPFRTGLTDKVYNGHVARFAEGNYAGFFGWPNLTNVPAGGFLGLPKTNLKGDMRIVDIYRRQGDKLAENWVFMDLPHYLDMQGLDIFARLRELQQ